MAYFSNGYEGQKYEAEFCSKCVHEDSGNNNTLCAVWMAHFIHNYDQCSNDDLASALNYLIPRDKDGMPKKCRMFLPKAAQQKLHADVCPACSGKGGYPVGVYHEACNVCNGTGKRP